MTKSIDHTNKYYINSNTAKAPSVTHYKAAIWPPEVK